MRARRLPPASRRAGDAPQGPGRGPIHHRPVRDRWATAGATTACLYNGTMSPPTHHPNPAPAPAARATTVYDLSVVAPAHNEAGNLAPLLAQIREAFRSTGLRVQVLLVDDGSTDATADELDALARRDPDLRVLRQKPARGQSAALGHGIAAATAPLIATLDADLQNDPADLPAMLALLRDRRADLVQGDRTAGRRDHAGRRAASAIGRLFRRMLLNDSVRDTGCATRVLRADLARRLPLDHDGMHRFIPACTAALGGYVVETRVNHRPRHAGQTKYGTGIFKRGLPGLRGCFFVRRLQRQHAPAPTRPPFAEPGAA